MQHSTNGKRRQYASNTIPFHRNANANWYMVPSSSNQESILRVANAHTCVDQHREKCNFNGYSSSRSVVDEHEAGRNAFVAGAADHLRRWEHTRLGHKLKHIANYGSNAGVVFKLMSYNVLAQTLLEKNPQLYNLNDPAHLYWNVRWSNLQQEISYHGAEIICLQEVDDQHLPLYNEFFQQLGYEGLFKKRTSDEYSDGCAIYYKTNFFTLVENTTVEYYQSNTPLLNRHNVGIIAKFAPKHAPKHHFLVSTTHLLYNPKREDVRLAQIQVLLTEIDRFAYQGKDKPHLPIVLCGDFNSLPNGGVNSFLVRKFVDYREYMSPRIAQWLSSKIGITNNCKHFALEVARNNSSSLTRTNEQKLINLEHSERTSITPKVNNKIGNADLFDTGFLSHNFDFTSIFQSAASVSTYQDRWILVDYMFSSKSMTTNQHSALKVLAKYELPTKTILDEYDIKNIPNNLFGSDHFSLVAKFKFEYGN